LHDRKASFDDLFPAVGHIGECRHDRDPGKGPNRTPDQVGLEEGGVDEIWSMLGDDVSETPRPADAPASADEGDELHTSLLEDGAPARALPEIGDGEIDVPVPVAGHEGGESLFGSAAEAHAVNHIQDAHRKPTTGCP